MTFEVLLGDLKHVAEVYFSLPNPNSDFLFFFFFLFALQSHQILLHRAHPIYYFPDPPIWSKFLCLWLSDVFVCYLSSDSHCWFSNVQTVWQHSCSKFHACSLKLPCIWKCAALYSKDVYYFIYFWKQNKHTAKWLAIWRQGCWAEIWLEGLGEQEMFEEAALNHLLSILESILKIKRLLEIN